MKKKRKNKGGRVVYLSTMAVVQAMVRDEENYLRNPEAAPNQVTLAMSGIPRFTPSHLRQGLGTQIAGLSAKDVQRYAVPERRLVFRLVRQERDRIISTHHRNGRVRERSTGRFVPTVEFELKIMALNRVMEMLRAN